MTKTRSPTKTELLVMRAHVDSMLNPQDAAGFHVHLSRIRTIVNDCIGDWAIERVEQLERELAQKRVEDDPEVVALVEAAKQWREQQKLIEDTNEVARNGETWKETQDRIFREMQGDYSDTALPIARSASFAECQASAQQKLKPQEDKA